MVLRSTVYRKSMALYSYFGSMVYIHLESLWAVKNKSISNFQILQCKRVCNPWVSNTLAVYLDFLPLLDFFLESFFLVFSGEGEAAHPPPSLHRLLAPRRPRPRPHAPPPPPPPPPYPFYFCPLQNLHFD